MNYQSKRMKKLITCTLLASSFVLAPVVSAENFDEQISTYQNEISDIDAQISELKAQSEEIKAELETLNSDIAANEQKVVEAQALIDETTEKINTLNQEIASLEENIAARQDQIDEQARTVQIDGNPTNYILFIIESESLTDAFNRLQIVGDMIDANNNTMDEQKADKQAVEAKHVEAEETLALHESTYNELQAISAELDEQKLAQEVLQTQVALTQVDKESDRQNVSNQLADAVAAKEAYEAEQARLAAEAAERARIAAEQEAARIAEADAKAAEEAEAARVAAANASSSSQQTGSSSNSNNVSASTPAASAPVSSGALGWPAASRTVTSNYGYRIHPIYGYNKLHTGIDIGGGGAIYAAEGGTVTNASYHYSYGNYIDISHGNGMTTRYAHLSSMNVSPGQTVSRGQNIGVMGTTGSSTGVHLHFEVIINGVQVNPANYIY